MRFHEFTSSNEPFGEKIEMSDSVQMRRIYKVYTVQYKNSLKLGNINLFYNSINDVDQLNNLRDRPIVKK